MLLRGAAIAFFSRLIVTRGLQVTPADLVSHPNVVDHQPRRCHVVATAKRRRPRENPSSSEWFDDERPQRNEDDYFEDADWFEEERPPRKKSTSRTPLWERARGRVRRAADAFLEEDVAPVRGRDRRDENADVYGEPSQQRRSRRKSAAPAVDFYRELEEEDDYFVDIDAEFGGRRFVERWTKWGLCDVLRPPDEDATNGRLPLAPVGVVHLVGGAVVGVSPKLSYEGLCTKLADRGFLVIATPLRLGPGGLFDHRGLATTCAKDFAAAWPFVEERYGASAATSLRIFGFGHSLGAKLHLLIGADPNLLELASPVPRAANVLVAYNNFKAEQSVPLLKEFRVLQAELAESDGALESAGGFVPDSEAALAAEAGAAARQRFAAASLRKRKEIDRSGARMSRKPVTSSSSSSPSFRSQGNDTATTTARVVTVADLDRDRKGGPDDDATLNSGPSTVEGAANETMSTQKSQRKSVVGSQIIEEAAVVAAVTAAEEVESRAGTEALGRSALWQGVEEEGMKAGVRVMERGGKTVFDDEVGEEGYDDLLDEDEAYDDEDDDAYIEDDDDGNDYSDEVYTRWFEDGSETYKQARFGPRQAAKLWQSTGWPLLRSVSQVVGSAASGAARGASKAARKSDVKLLRVGARLADDVVYEVGSAIDSVLDDDDDDEYDDDQYEGKSSSKSQGGAQLQSQSQSQSQSEQRQRRVSGKQRPGRRRRSRFSSPDAFLRTATKAATKAAAAVRGALATEFDPPPSEIEALVSNQYAIPCNLVVQFSSDSLDQSPRLATLLKRKFGAFGVPASPPSSAGSTAAFNRAEAAATREGSDLRSDSEGEAGNGAASAAAGLVRGAERSFARLPGNHGTPNDYNPGDTWPGSEEWGSSSSRGPRRGGSDNGYRDSSNTGNKQSSDAADVTIELGLLADCAADYMTDRALWRRPS